MLVFADIIFIRHRPKGVFCCHTSYYAGLNAVEDLRGMANRRGQRILMAEYSMRFMGIENQPAVCNPNTLQTLLLNKYGSFSTL